MKHIFALIATAILLSTSLSSCQKIIEFNGEVTDPQLVMVSLPSADSLWRVRVTESRFFLNSDTIKHIDNAIISVEVNGIPANAACRYEGDAVYNTGIRPHCGDSLSMHIEVPGKGSISASCRVPQMPQADDFRIGYDTTEYSYYDEYEDSTYIDISGNINVSFTLHDPTDVHNYYMVSIEEWNDYSNAWDSKNITVDDNLIFPNSVTSDILDIGLGDEENYGSQVLFDDQNFNGHDHRINISTYLWGVTKMRINVYAVNREMYLYYKTRKAAINNDFESLGGIFGEPVQIFCNIQGGIGILGASAAKTYMINSEL